MKLVLQSQDNYNEIAIIDLTSGTIESTQKTEGEVKTQGCYSVYDGKIIGFFRIEDILYFLLDRQKIQFLENDNVNIESLPDNHCLFSIQRGSEIIFSWKYKRRQITPSISAFQMVNPMISEEDFDIFVLIHNVINNRDRKERVFRHSQ